MKLPTSPKTVLIVDDDAEMRELLCSILAQTPHRIEEAENGRVALDVWDEVQPDLAIIDLVMPRIDGFELIKQLRAQGRREPLLAMSALDVEGISAEILRAGADDFVRKPFLADEVVARVRNLLATAEAYRLLAEKNRELEQARIEAEQAHEELIEFVRSASHDLRAPLRGIANLSSWLQEDLDELLDEQGERYLRLLQEKTDRMTRLVERLAQYSRIAHATGTDEVDIAHLLGRIVEKLEPPPHFDVRVKASVTSVETTPVLLEHALSNLVENALTHHDGEAGTIELEAREEADLIVFVVRDDGPGIPQEYQERVFLPFEKLDAGTPCAGLGLAIVQRCVDAIGASIELRSKGRGTRFELRWPRHIPRPPESHGFVRTAT